MNPNEDNPDCIKCGLFDKCRHPFMPLDGSMHPKVLVIGEAPGEEEDREGRPFVGRSGQLLRNVLNECGLRDGDIAFTNVVRCRPPDNKISIKYINHCKQFAWEEILSTNPEIVFLMGNSPLTGILRETGISTWNGVAVKKDGYKFVPLYHPAFILRDNNYLDSWLEAIMRAIDGEEERDTFEYAYPNSMQELRDMREFLREAEYISYDVETSSLDAFSNYSLILSLSMAGNGRAYSVVVDHPENPWSDEEFQDLVQIIVGILDDHKGKIVGHNIKFDMMHTKSIFGYEIVPGGDTMLISHLIDSKPGIHGLKHLAGVHLGMYDYEKDLNEYIREHSEANVRRGGSYANIPANILLRYGALDAKATILLNDLLRNKLSEKQKIFYEQVVMPASYVLGRMQINGFVLDKYIADRYSKIYEMIRGEKLHEIRNDKHVVAVVNRRKKPSPFNPGSTLQLRELYFKSYHIPEIAQTPKGEPSTSSRLYKEYEDEFPILRQIRMYKLMSKMLNTYLNPASSGLWTSGDGMVHTSYNQHGTITGRLSSSDPVNLQNIPTPDSEPGTILETLPIKNIFTHRDWLAESGNVVVPEELKNDGFDAGAVGMLDYSGMELRIFASCSNCEKMLKIFNETDKDVHTMVGSMISRLKYEEITRPMRYKYKWTSWTLLYGGDEYTLSALYDIPLDECQRTVREYYDTFPEVLDYRKYTQDFAEEHGYIESVFGRREHLPYIEDDRDITRRNAARRAAVNMPIQSAASDTLLCALIVADAELRKKNMRSLLVNTVHDSVVIDMPREEIEESVSIVKNAMENVKQYAKIYFPDIDFSWLKARLKADIDIGTHYGSGISYDEWRKCYGIKIV